MTSFVSTCALDERLTRGSLPINLRVPGTTHLPLPVTAVACGAGIGLLSGLTGTGGGIFLSPLLLMMGWAETRQTGGVSAAFILVNSAAGLAGNPGSLGQLPPSSRSGLAPPWLADSSGPRWGADVMARPLSGTCLDWCSSSRGRS